MQKYKKGYRKKNLKIHFLLFIFVVAMCFMGVGYSMYSDTLTIDGVANAKYTIYEIAYVLNGGTNPENVVESFKVTDDIPLPVPTKKNYKFVGWYDNENFAEKRLFTTNDLKSDVTLYAKWEIADKYEDEYSYSGEYVFTGDNYIDTNICLFSKENIDKNFMISFDIVSVDEKNVNHSALMNSMNESGSPWYGCVVKVSESGKNKSQKFESNSNTSSSGDAYIGSDVRNVRIVRANNILYYSFDGGYFIKINDYNGFNGTFDIPVTFGASLDGKKKPFRYFTGTLANMSVRFLDDSFSVDELNPTPKEVKVAYEYPGEIEFDGETSYVDTGLCMFSAENIHKDFEISFNIDYVGTQSGNQATIINAKNESISSYPAFVYRLYQAYDGTIRFESKGGKGTGATNKIVDVKKVKISRKKLKMYLSINDGPEIEVYDFTGFSNYFSVPLTIGASLDSKGKPFRFFNGKLSNIKITVQEY